MSDTATSEGAESRPRFDRRPAAPHEELSAQMERGSQMLQASLNNVFRRLAAVDEILGEVVEALAVNDLVEPSQVPAAIRAFGVAESGSESDERTFVSGPAMDPGGDGEGDDPFRWPAVVLGTDTDEEVGKPVDCAARVAVCHAVCCMLKFALSAEEVEAGVVKWDIGHPYLIRGDRDGFCTHNAPDSGCQVYEDRPGVCRRYSCADDDRIWTDFDAMELNTEWIDAHLPNSGKVHLTISRKGGAG